MEKALQIFSSAASETFLYKYTASASHCDQLCKAWTNLSS